MPGVLTCAEPHRLAGWAVHAAFRDYHVVVHLVHGTAILATFVAREAAPPGAPEEAEGHCFDIDLTAYPQVQATLHQLRLLIGETDEMIEPFPRSGAAALLSIEDILATWFPRRWVSGKIHLDAMAEGASPETIIDMFYRDWFGRPADPAGLAGYADKLRSGALSAEQARDILLEAGEYTESVRTVDDAPGAIFSQEIVLLSGELMASRSFDDEGDSRVVPESALLEFEGERFVTEAYRRLFGREVDPEGMAFYTSELRRGRARADLVKTLANEPDALARGVVLVRDEAYAYGLTEAGVAVTPQAVARWRHSNATRHRQEMSRRRHGDLTGWRLQLDAGGEESRAE